MLSTAVPIVRNGRTIGALEVEQSLDAVHSQVRQDVLALIGDRGARAGAGARRRLDPRRLHREAAALARRGGAPARRRGLRGPRTRARLERAGRGGTRVQRDGGPARCRARIPAGVRRGRLAPAPHPPDRTAAPARGRGGEDRRSGRTQGARGGGARERPARGTRLGPTRAGLERAARRGGRAPISTRRPRGDRALARARRRDRVTGSCSTGKAAASCGPARRSSPRSSTT